MKNRIFLKIIVHFFVVCGAILSIADHVDAAIRIVGFGDSITAGWPYLINGEGCQCPLEGYEVQLDELMLANGYNTEVYNYGVSGETTDEALNDARIDSVIAIEAPDYVLLMEGTNDLLSSDPEIVRDNLEIMVDQVLAGGAIPILATITPDIRPKGLDKGIVATNDLIKALAVEQHVLLSDQYAAVVSDWANLTGDGLHPNEAGYGRLAETWYDTLRDQLGILTLSTEGKGEGSVTYNPPGESCTNCSLTYSKGTEITLTAIPAPGSVFTGWSGVCSDQGKAPLCVFTIDQNMSVTATFGLPYSFPWQIFLPAIISGAK